MVTFNVTAAGNSSYSGDILDVIDFEAPGAATLSVISSDLRTSAPGVLAVSLLGSPNPDTLAIQMIDGLIDARAVTFGEGWTGLADRIVIRDTGLDSTIWGGTGADRIEVTGGADSVDGWTGLDRLVVSWGFRSEDFTMDGSQRILGSDGTAVAYSGIERLEIRLGSGDDSVAGLGGRDTILGGMGTDTLNGIDGDDRLFGGGDEDVLRGQRGRDLLDGGRGDDMMLGGYGDDTYVVDSEGDMAVESANAGIDAVRSRIDVDLLGTNIENATLLGTHGTDALGGAGANVLQGNSGGNALGGRGGRDDLRGGDDAAQDQFVFFSVSDSTGRGRDLVRGFDADNEDKIMILLTEAMADQFAGVTVASRTGGTLDADSFNADVGAALNGTLAAGGLNQAILWDPTGGGLDRMGHRYLVIDMDNDGSYLAGRDLVIQFLYMHGSLDLSDFLVSDAP